MEKIEFTKQRGERDEEERRKREEREVRKRGCRERHVCVLEIEIDGTERGGYVCICV